ncbi:MAG: response regulator [Pseudomonadales bacterium]
MTVAASGKIRVLVVDDHQLVRLGTKRLLESQRGIAVLATARNGEEAVSITSTLKPDVVLMDVQMPGIGGLEATRRCLRVHPEVKVIAVTVYDDEPYPSQLFKVGAAGYMTKNADKNELLMAIHKVVDGERYICVEVAQQMALRPFQVDETSPFDYLSTREMQITLMIAIGHRVADISARLSLSPKTVNSYRYRIFEKLNVLNDVGLAKLAILHGVVDAGAA